MKIGIKEFDVKMEIKNNGIELDVYDNDGNHRGDLVITKTRLIWCQGKTTRPKGVHVTWNEFIEWMQS